MFERFRHSYLLFKECIRVLRKDKEMLLFPIFAGVFTLIVVTSFIIPIGYFIELKEGFQLNAFVYYGLFVFYLLTYSIIYFFNTAMIICAGERLKGGNPTFRGGIRAAFEKINKIFFWALISAVIGVSVRLFERVLRSLRFGHLSNIYTSLFGIGWSLATYFTIPVMVFEDAKPFLAIKKSTQIFKQTWGESVIGNFGLSSFMKILFLLGIFVMLAIMFIIYNIYATSTFWPYFIVAIGTVIYSILLFIISNVLQNIYTTALYFYAVNRDLNSGFSSEMIKNTWLPKKQVDDI